MAVIKSGQTENQVKNAINKAFDDLSKINVSGQGLVELTSQYVTVWNLEPAIYKWVYDGQKYIQFTKNGVLTKVSIGKEEDNVVYLQVASGSYEVELSGGIPDIGGDANTNNQPEQLLPDGSGKFVNETFKTFKAEIPYRGSQSCMVYWGYVKDDYGMVYTKDLMYIPSGETKPVAYALSRNSLGYAYTNNAIPSLNDTSYLHPGEYAFSLYSGTIAAPSDVTESVRAVLRTTSTCYESNTFYAPVVVQDLYINGEVYTRTVTVNGNGVYQYGEFKRQQNLKSGSAPCSIEQTFMEDGTKKGSTANGKYSAALNQNNTAYQRNSFVTGGGSEAGLSEEEFNAKYPIGYDGTGSEYDKSNSFANAGGQENKAKGRGAHIGGGYRNTVAGDFSGVVAGGSNVIDGRYSGIMAGNNNDVTGDNSGVLDGSNNKVSGDNSGAGGVNNSVETDNTHTFGANLISRKRHDATMVGRYNNTDSYAIFQVGTGWHNEETGVTHRRNSFEVFENGVSQFNEPTKFVSDVDLSGANVIGLSGGGLSRRKISIEALHRDYLGKPEQHKGAIVQLVLKDLSKNKLTIALNILGTLHTINGEWIEKRIEDIRTTSGKLYISIYEIYMNAEESSFFISIPSTIGIYDFINSTYTEPTCETIEINDDNFDIYIIE